MDSIIEQIITFVLSGPQRLGVVGIMTLVTIGSLWVMDKKDKEHKEDIKQMIEQAQKQTDINRQDLLNIIEKYQQGQINVIQAINEIKVLLATIGAKL